MVASETDLRTKVTNHNTFFFHPGKKKGLEEVILLPGSEKKYRSSVPNSSVWVFNRFGHSYDPSILGQDVGCGVTGFKLPKLEFKEAADMIAEYLKDKQILGRGNHFVDLCSSIYSQHVDFNPNYSAMLIHTDGKEGKQNAPKTIPEAEKRRYDAEMFRRELGEKLADILGVTSHCFGNWTHNSVEVCNEKVIYRKGTIKAKAEEINVLLASLGREVFLYTVVEKNMPPFSSMPHGTGRIGPLSDIKATIEKARELRRKVYVPETISDSSLRSEHPDCYHDFQHVLKELHQYMVGLGHLKIKAYVGKI